MTYLEAVEDTSSYAGADEKSEDFYGGGGQFRKGGKEHFPQLWCSNGTYSSYGQVTACVMTVSNSIPCLVEPPKSVRLSVCLSVSVSAVCCKELFPQSLLSVTCLSCLFCLSVFVS